MKKRISSLLAALAVGVLTIACTFTTFSADDKLALNENVSAVKGDKVTYNIYISDVPEKVEDIQMEVYYDSKYLKPVDNSVKYPEGGSSVYNTKIADKVLFNSANGINGWDFSKRTLLMGVTFTVEEAGESSLSYYIQCMDYLSNSMPIDDYIITCDYLVNGKVAEKEAVPVVDENGEGGNFINFSNGKGEKNGGDNPVGGQYGGGGNDGNNANNGNNGNQGGNDSNNGGNGNNGNNNANGNVQQGDNNQNGNNGGNVVGQDATAQGETTESTAIRTNSSGAEITTPDGEKASYTDSDDMWRNIGIIVLALAIVGCIVVIVIIDKRKKAKKDE